MKNIIFVCHGNICRSPAAQWVMKTLIEKYELQDRFNVISRATSLEEIGNDIYPPMKRALSNRNIAFLKHSAKQITQKDYEWADVIYYMDSNNKAYLQHLLNDTKEKFVSITDGVENLNYIEDPWYTGSYDIVLDQIIQCCEHIIIKNKR